MFMHFVWILDTPILGFNRYMDFLKEIGTSKLYTFHSHTEFCDGRATASRRIRLCPSNRPAT